MNLAKSLLPIAALALSGIAAAGTHQANSISVRFGDLNLRSESGIASLHQRIRTAANSVCAPLDSRVLALRAAHRDCVAQAVEQGVRAVQGKTRVLASN